MEILKEMFPQHGEDALRAALASAEGDLEMASALLLSADSAPKPSAHPVAVPMMNPEVPVVSKKKRFEDDWSVRLSSAQISPSTALVHVLKSCSLAHSLLMSHSGHRVAAQ